METKGSVIAYKTGIRGKAEVLFGGKVLMATFSGKSSGTHGIAFAELYEKGQVGHKPTTTDFHDPQVLLVFDSLKSVELLERELMAVRELFKRDAEWKATAASSSNQPASILDSPVKDLDLSVRTLNVMMAYDLFTVRDVVRMKPGEWIKLQHAGKRSLTELENFLKANNLSWGMDV